MWYVHEHEHDHAGCGHESPCGTVEEAPRMDWPSQMGRWYIIFRPEGSYDKEDCHPTDAFIDLQMTCDDKFNVTMGNFLTTNGEWDIKEGEAVIVDPQSSVFVANGVEHNFLFTDYVGSSAMSAGASMGMILSRQPGMNYPMANHLLDLLCRELGIDASNMVEVLHGYAQQFYVHHYHYTTYNAPTTWNWGWNWGNSWNWGMPSFGWWF